MEEEGRIFVGIEGESLKGKKGKQRMCKLEQSVIGEREIRGNSVKGRKGRGV